MAEPTPRPDRPGRRGPARPLLALAALLPLAAAVAAVSTVDPTEQTPVTRAVSTAQQGGETLACAGPLSLPEALLEGGGDAELSVTPPSTTVGLRTVSLEPDSSVLFGTVSASSTLQDDQGRVRTPSITASDAEGTVLSDASAAEDLGVSVQTLTDLEAAPSVRTETSEAGLPVADAVQSTSTTSGDYRSLMISRCGAAQTDAAFLGVSTETGDSSVLVLRNPTTRPATASVQVWTADGPAAMEGRSQVVVAPGAEETVLLESVAAGEAALGVDVSVLGAPLQMHVQTTERDGLTPGGAEIQQPLPAADEQQIMTGVETAGISPVLTLANPSGADTRARVRVLGADGPLDAAEVPEVELPAGAVVQVPLEDLPTGTWSVEVNAEAPVHAATRSSQAGVDLAGDTVSNPVDFTFAVAAPAIGTSALLALPAQGAAGVLSLTATEDTAVTLVPLYADGTAGEPVEVEAAAGTAVGVTDEPLRRGAEKPAAVTVVPDVPGVLHASWTQRENDGTGGVLLSSLPVLPARLGANEVMVRLAD
ncbi:DUF5719 family protein [Brachybacterium sp. J153]|uniref:DUF5719 family protein n=1 Tax=Brachybacterium sp. J153 TaxID=3116488 RepID=UPI002E780B27|nr:DUF5719 family protein [Brachybacterium sp. J153]MEE1616897.1 DUF5719 family protein [Brachybacterium sp. J153]